MLNLKVKQILISSHKNATPMTDNAIQLHHRTCLIIKFDVRLLECGDVFGDWCTGYYCWLRWDEAKTQWLCFKVPLVRMQRFGLGWRLWDTDRLLLLLKVTFPTLFAMSQKGLVTMTDFKALLRLKHPWLRILEIPPLLTICQLCSFLYCSVFDVVFCFDTEHQVSV